MSKTSDIYTVIKHYLDFSLFLYFLCLRIFVHTSVLEEKCQLIDETILKEDERKYEKNNMNKHRYWSIPRTMIPAPDSMDFRQEPAGKSSFPTGKLRKRVGRWKQ